jgi:nitrous oxide reductase
MSSLDATRAAAERAAAAAEPGSRLSRRSMLRGAATAGAAGLAVTAMGAVAGPARAAVTPSSSPDLSTAHAEPIIVHVRDARSGDIEVFSGESQTRLRDKDLAARIARAIG